jgi:hypothetical protein
MFGYAPRSPRLPVPENATTVGRNFAKIGKRAIGILNVHTPRNVLNAASTSLSIATPLRSASSIALNSSGVAWYMLGLEQTAL